MKNNFLGSNSTCPPDQIWEDFRHPFFDKVSTYCARTDGATCAQSGFEDGLHKAIDVLNKELTSGRSIFTTKNKNKSK